MNSESKVPRPLRITIYSKKDCHLCENAKSILRKFAVQYPLEIEDIDIETHKEFFDRFQQEIPVVYFEGRKLFKFRIDEKRLHRTIRDAIDAMTQ
jgi:glutaredoxin